jgi:pyrroloquinoline quinone biosynthesis protein A
MLLANVMRTKLKRRIIMWTTPAATEMRFGFEVTMYVMNK